MNRRLFVTLALFLFSCTVSAEQHGLTVKLKKNQPRQVAALIDRIIDCNHWLGEPTYDADRANEINQAVSELRCNKLEEDEMTIRRKYRGNLGVNKAIDAAKDIMR